MRVSLSCVVVCSSIFTASLACLAPAAAQVTTAAYWRLGEHDLGAQPGDPCQPVTRDATSFFDLTRQGTLSTNNGFYDANVSPAAVTATGSTLAIRFDNLLPGDPCRYFTAADPLGGATDNYGLEMWVRAAGSEPVSGDAAAVVYNGTPGVDGFGIYQNGDQWEARFSGGSLFGPAVDVGEWVHLALVADNGTRRFYVDGVEYDAESDEAVFAASGGFGLGAVFDGSAAFTGAIDEVRVFTFVGPFNSNDLLVNQVVPEPSSWMLFAVITAVLVVYLFAGKHAKLPAK